MDRDLQTILLRDNPWIENPGGLPGWLHGHLPERFIPRRILAAAEDRWRQTDRAHLVVGPRQAGNLVNLSEWASILGIHFWRSTSRAEVDFVFDTGAAIIGLEVKAGKTGRQSIPRSARSFIDAYRPRHFLIVGNERFDPERIHGTEVAWITLDELAPTAEEIAG